MREGFKGIEILRVLEWFSEEFKPKRPSTDNIFSNFRYACEIVRGFNEAATPLLKTWLNATKPSKYIKRKRKKPKSTKKR